MRSAILFTALFLAGCGSAEKVEEPVTDTPPAEVAAPVDDKEKTANTGLSAIAYPKCASAIEGNRPTKCGKKVFAVAMSECRSRAGTWEGQGTIIDEYTGDSWQRAAGSASATDETRLKSVGMGGVGQGSLETVAFAKGNGTSDIQMYNCDLDAGLKLTKVAQSYTVNKPVL